MSIFVSIHDASSSLSTRGSYSSWQELDRVPATEAAQQETPSGPSLEEPADPCPQEPSLMQTTHCPSHICSYSAPPPSSCTSSREHLLGPVKKQRSWSRDVATPGAGRAHDEGSWGTTEPTGPRASSSPKLLDTVGHCAVRQEGWSLGSGLSA